jgi:hypothetical protein
MRVAVPEVSLPSPWRSRVATLGPLRNDQARRRHTAGNMHTFSVRSETCRVFSASLAQGRTCHLEIDRRLPTLPELEGNTSTQWFIQYPGWTP